MPMGIDTGAATSAPHAATLGRDVIELPSRWLPAGDSHRAAGRPGEAGR